MGRKRKEESNMKEGRREWRESTEKDREDILKACR